MYDITHHIAPGNHHPTQEIKMKKVGTMKKVDTIMKITFISWTRALLEGPH